MRRIKKEHFVRLIYDLCVRANVRLREDVRVLLEQEQALASNPLVHDILSVILENASIAQLTSRPLCQDTGLVIVEICLKAGAYCEFNIEEAVDIAVAAAYKDYGFRNSIVMDPITRNTPGNYNTPSIVHLSYTTATQDQSLTARVLIKGFGSENKTKLFNLNPTDAQEGIVAAVKEAVREAGADACPPYIVGVGVGGTCDLALWLSKKALFDDVRVPNPMPRLAVLEKDIQDSVNELDIGPMGVGGGKTVLAVRVLSHPTHIAGLPIAVNINCYLLRTAEGTM